MVRSAALHAPFHEESSVKPDFRGTWGPLSAVRRTAADPVFRFCLADLSSRTGSQVEARCRCFRQTPERLDHLPSVGACRQPYPACFKRILRPLQDRAPSTKTVARGNPGAFRARSLQTCISSSSCVQFLVVLIHLQRFMSPSFVRPPVLRRFPGNATTRSPACAPAPRS